MNPIAVFVNYTITSVTWTVNLEEEEEEEEGEETEMKRWEEKRSYHSIQIMFLYCIMHAVLSLVSHYIYIDHHNFTIILLNLITIFVVIMYNNVYV